MSLNPLPRPDITDGKGNLKPPWQSWFASVFQWLGPQGQHGTTATRPMSSLYVGLSYFDSTLGYPVWVKSLNPTVWVNGTGATV